jgi:hypothetical protein
MKTLLALSLALLFAGCSAIKWSSHYNQGEACLCVSYDTTKAPNVSALTRSLKASKAIDKLPPALVDSLAAALNNRKR